MSVVYIGGAPGGGRAGPVDRAAAHNVTLGGALSATGKSTTRKPLADNESQRVCRRGSCATVGDRRMRRGSDGLRDSMIRCIGLPSYLAVPSRHPSRPGQPGLNALCGIAPRRWQLSSYYSVPRINAALASSM